MASNSTVLKDKIRKPMRLKIGPEFHCLEDEDLKTDEYIKRTRNPVFGRIRSEFLCI